MIPDNTGNTGTLDSGMSREICSSIQLFFFLFFFCLFCLFFFSFWHVCKSKQMLHFLLQGGSLLNPSPPMLCCLPAWLVMSSIRSSQMAIRLTPLVLLARSRQQFSNTIVLCVIV